MSKPTRTASAAEVHPDSINPLSDEYVNAMIRQHGYDSPEAVIARLGRWIGLKGGENSATLLMCEAHKALSKLRAEGVQAGDERRAIDSCGYVAVKASAVDWLKKHYPALTIKAGLCERYAGRLYTLARLMRDHDAALASAPVAGVALGWRVRERRSNDGKLLDCFVEAPAAPGMAYAQEVLGDDYADAQGGIEGKLKHCQMIVAWANAAPQAITGKPVSLENHGLAAPQASEAVPMHRLAVAALNDLLLDIRAELGLSTTDEGRAILDTIRALKTQADKDGCANG